MCPTLKHIIESAEAAAEHHEKQHRECQRAERYGSAAYHQGRRDAFREIASGIRLMGDLAEMFATIDAIVTKPDANNAN